jgi:hypothetical protein
VPLALDPALAPVAEPLADALYRIGMGCQVLDDMVDLVADRAMHRHNYLASLIVHRSADREAARAGLDGADDVRALLERHPEARREASAQAMAFLGDGLRALLGPQGAPLIPAAVDFLVRRIGAGDLLDQAARA